MKRVKSSFIKIFSPLYHVIVLGAVFWVWSPVARWYYTHRPVLGVDFYNTVTYVAYLMRNFSLRGNGWKYIWYTGNAMEHDYPSLYFYLIIPLAKIVGPVQGVLLFMLVAFFLFILFAYLAFWEMSKDRILSGILSIGVAYSIGVYGALVWGGSLPYFISQTFFAATLYLVIKYLNNGNKKLLSGASLLTALSVFGHPQVAVTFIFPIVAILVWFWARKGYSLFDRRKVSDLLLFFGLVLLITYPVIIFEQAGANIKNQINFTSKFVTGLLQQLINGMKSVISFKQIVPRVMAAGEASAQGASAGVLEIERWRRSQVSHLFDWTNPIFFTLLQAGAVLYVITVIIRFRKRKFLHILPLILIASYVLFYIWIYGQGIEFYHGGWYRVFWAVPVILGLIICRVWGDFWSFWRVFLDKRNRFLYPGVMILTSGALLVVANIVLTAYNPTLVEKFDNKQAEFSHSSSAFPSIVNSTTKIYTPEEMKAQFTPSWLDPFSKDYRLLESDAQVNIWWNAYFDMPLAKGYIDPPSGESWFFWLNAAVFAHDGQLSQLVDNWNVPEPVALNDALFLLDWYGVKYLEADHVSDVTPNISQALLDREYIKQDEEVFFATYEEIIDLDVTERDETSPVQAVNKPHLLFIGSTGVYDKLVDYLFAQESLSFIPIRLGEEVDTVLNQNDINDFDLVFLSGHGYREAGEDRDKYLETWEVLADYVEGGGHLFIDPVGNAVDVSTKDARGHYSIQMEFHPDAPAGSQYWIESYEPTLPEPFPIARTITELVEEGTFSGQSHAIAEVVNFGELIAEEGINALSLPSEGIRSGAKTVATYNGTPVVVERDFGKGKVIWSGLGFLSRSSKLQGEAGRFFDNLVEYYHPGELARPKFTAQSQNIGKSVDIVGEKARGILIERLGNEKIWQISSQSSDQPLKISSVRTGEEAVVYLHFPKNMWDSQFEVNLTNEGIQKLHFYELADEIVSPIMMTTNAPTLGVVGRINSFETVVRSLAINNIGSRNLIPLHLGARLDDISSEDLNNVDVLLLYGYDYRNHSRVWRQLDDFVQNGGKLFIDTGSEVKQTDSENLPAQFPKDLPSVFPLERTQKKELGKNWDLVVSESLDDQIAIDEFGPPVMDDKAWVFSLPADSAGEPTSSAGEPTSSAGLPAESAGLRSGASTLLSNQGQPLVVSWNYGEGEVIWSGMNLFYHTIHYNNLTEARFLGSLLSNLVRIEKRELPQFVSKRVSSEKAVVEGSEAQGVLFKERSHAGWKASIESPSSKGKLKIYNAGPTYPGFMYVRVPSASQSESFKVTFNFRGTFWGYFYSLISYLSLIIVAAYTLLPTHIFMRLVGRFWSRIQAKAGKWWEKEEDY